MALWSGRGVGLVSKVQPAGDIVREIVDETQGIIRGLAQ
jgi:hypothetical protein